MLTIYTDGSCKGNPGPGGFGVIVIENEKVIYAYQETEENTTNNRMEMKAILWTLERAGGINYRGIKIDVPIVYTDSAYCVNSFTDWINNWKANGWTRPGGKKIENLDLIQKYDELIQKGKAIDLRKCKGHAGNIWNELADKLATGKITAEQVMEEYGEKI